MYVCKLMLKPMPHSASQGSGVWTSRVVEGTLRHTLGTEPTLPRLGILSARSIGMTKIEMLMRLPQFRELRIR